MILSLYGLEKTYLEVHFMSRCHDHIEASNGLESLKTCQNITKDKITNHYP